MSQNDEQNEEILSTQGRGDTFANVLERSISRRALLKGSLTAGAAILAAPVLAEAETASAQSTAPPLDFTPIGASTAAEVTVPPGYRAAPLLRWGDPILPGAPDFDPANQTPEAQAGQFGYNCDFVGFLPLPLGGDSSSHGLLVVNHEYTNPELMFVGYTLENPTKEQVDIDLAGHGLSVVEVNRSGANGPWGYSRNSRYNRRITATTPMGVSGPAAGSDWLKTTDDPAGTNVLGTLNNCAAGKTPWGTVLTAEENFHQYFANRNGIPDSNPAKKIHTRYGLTAEASDRKWERFYNRFDLSKEPNEALRHGWVVEVDPYDPTFTPVKRTALGRFKHEAATTVVATSGQVVLYTGDDERFEYVYKFVSARPYSRSNRQANFGLLDDGTLYAAKFNDDGSGQWLPLVHGQGPLTAANGFTSQADVLVNTRGAADLLGATKMDRPEDIETNPVNRKVYMIMTNNTQRGTDTRPGTDAANPRKENRHGHIIEVTETGNNHAGTTFNWNMFLICGEPSDDSTYYAGYPKDRVSAISSPDNMMFDSLGNLWIATDGQTGTLKVNDGIFAVPVEGPERGYLRQFFAGVPGGEVCGPELTPDNTTFFVAIQHPGEGGNLSEPDKMVSRWPDGTIPRPSVVAIQPTNGGRIGISASALASAPGGVGMPRTGDGASFPNPLLVVAGLGAAALGALIRIRARGDSAEASEAGGEQS